MPATPSWPKLPRVRLGIVLVKEIVKAAVQVLAFPIAALVAVIHARELALIRVITVARVHVLIANYSPE